LKSDKVRQHVTICSIYSFIYYHYHYDIYYDYDYDNNNNSNGRDNNNNNNEAGDVTKGEMEGGDDKKDPNDARCVVWALSKFFFSHWFFLILINVLLHVVSTDYVTRGNMEGGDDKKGPNISTDYMTRGKMEGGDNKKGPNDASGAIISKFFFFFSFVSFDTN
jgi:hypothetical protein